ncbi:hypothetical protein SY88_08705 [Clostridiales bacterium PH28_bin88]|nr:hypothetical protein SY88_08705 [Clostridiales bacterium PH28_bin88]
MSVVSKCQHCAKKHPEKICRECPDLIGGGSLMQVLPQALRVNLLSPDGENYTGEVLVINPIALGIRTSAPLGVPYEIKIMENLTLKVAAVRSKGKGDIRAYDILNVSRPAGTSDRLNNDEFKLLTGGSGELIQELTESLPENIKDAVRRQLMEEIERSEIIKAMQVAQVMKYERGRFRHLGGEKELDVPVRELEDLMRNATRTGTPGREVIISADGKRVVDLHGIPFDYQSGGVLALDITDVIEKEREIHRLQLNIYRDVISAMTGGRLQLVTDLQCKELQDQGELIGQGRAEAAEDIGVGREILRNLTLPLPKKQHRAAVLCLSEALTNAVKHAQKGRWCARWTGKSLRMVITDEGPGMKLSSLPKATLMKHYSTGNSLGCGFTLMLYYADTLYLYSNPSGTTVIMDFSVEGAVNTWQINGS